MYTLPIILGSDLQFPELFHHVTARFTGNQNTGSMLYRYCSTISLVAHAQEPGDH